VAIVRGASSGVPASSRARFPCSVAGAEVLHVAPHVAATHYNLASHPLGLAYPSCSSNPRSDLGLQSSGVDKHNQAVTTTSTRASPTTSTATASGRPLGSVTYLGVAGQ